jgi:hypothetical protein
MVFSPSQIISLYTGHHRSSPVIINRTCFPDEMMARQWKRKSIGTDGVDTTCSGPVVDSGGQWWTVDPEVTPNYLTPPVGASINLQKIRI